MTSTIHLIHGYLGSGKTTFAKDLERQTGGLRISRDDWLIGLSQDHVVLDPVLLASLNELLGDLWPRIAAAGADHVILDFGFWTRAARDEARARAAAVGANVVLYDVQCPADVALDRCLRRTVNNTTDYHIDADAFDALRDQFEPLGTDEPAVAVKTGP